VKIDISAAQLEALQAAKRGEIFGTSFSGTARLWLRQARPDDTPRAVTRTVWILIERGLMQVGRTDDHGRFPVVLTEAGLAVLDELASREPAKETGNG
jgi:hypothetical protein